MYIRLAQGKADAVLYEKGSIKPEVGGAVTAREGSDVAIFAHGEMVRQALEAAEDLEKAGIHARVVDMYCIKPINKEVILKAARETGGIVVVEDHLMEGGLASAISDVLVDQCVAPKGFKRLGIPQVYAGFGSGPEQRTKYGYDKNATVAAAKAILKK
jgi:transketolase